MIRTLPQGNAYRFGYRAYILAYFAFLFAPLVVTCVLAFNDSQFPALPWKGFTLEWFVGDLPHRVGIFHDQVNLDSIGVSFQVAFWVTLAATVVEDTDTVGQIADKPLQSEPFPGQGRKLGIVEGQDASYHQGGEQKGKIGQDISPVAEAVNVSLGQRANHWTTRLSFWRVSLSPAQITVEDNTSRRKPNAAPWFQLKLAMNWL